MLCHIKCTAASSEVYVQERAASKELIAGLQRYEFMTATFLCHCKHYKEAAHGLWFVLLCNVEHDVSTVSSQTAVHAQGQGFPSRRKGTAVSRAAKYAYGQHLMYCVVCCLLGVMLWHWQSLVH